MNTKKTLSIQRPYYFQQNGEVKDGSYRISFIYVWTSLEHQDMHAS